MPDTRGLHEDALTHAPSTSQEKATQSGSALSRTPLYDLHVQHGAKMVPFAGFEMPLTYKWGGQRLSNISLLAV